MGISYVWDCNSCNPMVCLMQEHILYASLFDCYGKLLTTKQQEYFKLYYFDNLTLSEIAENDNVSRNAVHKSIKDAMDKLDFYESNLHLNQLKKKIDSSNLDEKLKSEFLNIIE